MQKIIPGHLLEVNSQDKIVRAALEKREVTLESLFSDIATHALNKDEVTAVSCIAMYGLKKDTCLPCGLGKWRVRVLLSTIERLREDVDVVGMDKSDYPGELRGLYNLVNVDKLLGESYESGLNRGMESPSDWLVWGFLQKLLVSLQHCCCMSRRALNL